MPNTHHNKAQQPTHIHTPCPVSQELDAKQVAPELYPYGSRGPIGAHYLAAKHGVRWGDVGTEEEDES